MALLGPTIQCTSQVLHRGQGQLLTSTLLCPPPSFPAAQTLSSSAIMLKLQKKPAAATHKGQGEDEQDWKRIQIHFYLHEPEGTRVILSTTHVLHLWWPPIFLLEECQLVTDYSSPGAPRHSNNTCFHPKRGAVASWQLWPNQHITSHTCLRSGTSRSSATRTFIRLAGCNPMTFSKHRCSSPQPFHRHRLDPGGPAQQQTTGLPVNFSPQE